MSEQFTVTGRILFNTEGFERGIVRASKKLKNFGSAANRAGRDLTTAVSLPLSLAAAAAIRTATSFELAQRKIQALRPTNNIEKLTKSARELGASTIFTAEEVSQLQLSLAKLGKSDREIQQVQSTVLKFAQAMDQDLATSGEFLVKTMNRYAESLKEVGDTQAQAAYVGNLFASVAANTALDAQKLAAALNYVGSEAAVYGITLEDTAAILGLLADRGFDASRGGTALRRILAQLGKDGYTASEAIEELLNPTRGFSEELEKFGLRGAGPAAALGGLRDEFEALKETIGSSNSFLNEFALVLDNSLSASFKRVKSAAQEVSIAFTTEFGDAIRTITDNIVRLLRGFAELPKPIKRIVVGLGAFLAVAGPVLTILGALTAAVGALGLALTLAFGPAGVVVAAIATVLGVAATAIVLLTENTDAAAMSMDELRRKVYESNEEFRVMSTSDLVSEDRLRRVAQLQFEIEGLTKKLEKLRSSAVGSSYNRQIEATTKRISELKDEQKKLNDEFKKFLSVQDDIIKAQKEAIESGTFIGPVIPDFASDGEGGVADDFGTTLQALLDQRQEILNRINSIKGEAKGGGLFQTDELKKQDSLLSQIESTLKLLGITFDKNGKQVKKLDENFTEVPKTLQKLDSSGQKVKETFKLMTDEEAMKRFDTALAGLGVPLQALKTGANEAYVAVQDIVNELEKEELLSNISDIENVALAIGDIFGSAFKTALDGTESLAESIRTTLTDAITSLIAKLAALAIAWGVVALLATIATGGSNLGKAATSIKSAGFGNFILDGLGLGSFDTRSQSGGNLRVEGVLSGSDVVLSSRRGATALDRIYG
jgi:hypothetical protein